MNDEGYLFEPIQVVYDGLENYEEVCKINVRQQSL